MRGEGGKTFIEVDCIIVVYSVWILFRSAVCLSDQKIVNPADKQRQFWSQVVTMKDTMLVSV